MAGRWPEAARIEIGQLAAALADVKAAYKSSERKRGALERRVALLEQQLASAQAALVKAQATIREYQHQLYGRHHEGGPVRGAEGPGTRERAAEATGEGAAATAAETPPPPPPPHPGRRKRGAKSGHRGHGRHTVGDLPHADQIQTLPEEQRRCPKCGVLYAPMPGAYAVSLLLDWAVSIFYWRCLRQRYRRTCSCEGPKRILVAPPPAKVIRKGLLSAQFIARICVEKFWLGHPLHRSLRALGLDVPALPVSRGGVTRVLKQLPPLLEPLYAAICDQVREASLAAADETTASVFCPEDEPERQPDHRPDWWAWCFKAKQAVAFKLDQRRNADVPFAFFGWDRKQGPPVQPWLILLTDCYSVYKTLTGWVINAYCWAHLRRRFVKAALTSASAAVGRWAEGWRQRIATLYALHAVRRQAAPDTPSWQAADQALRAHVAAMRATAERQLHSGDLLPVQAEVLESLLRHWAGLTLFLDHPEVPLDNNEVERILRGPVVGRKNFLLFGNLWSAHLAEMLWSILATAACNECNPLTYLTAYLQACAENGGQALDGAALKRFLPWDLTPADRAVWSRPLPSILQHTFLPQTPAPRRRVPPCRRSAPVPAAVKASPEVDSS